MSIKILIPLLDKYSIMCPSPSPNYEFLLLLLSRFSRVRLCATPEMAAHQAPPSLGFSRQEHWSGLPFPSPVHESEKWKWSRSVVSDSSRPHGLQPTRLLHPWIFQARILEWGAIESYNNIIERKTNVNKGELFPLSQFKLNSKLRLNQLKS